jgi:hypothetical protein
LDLGAIWRLPQQWQRTKPKDQSDQFGPFGLSIVFQPVGKGKPRRLVVRLGA